MQFNLKNRLFLIVLLAMAFQGRAGDSLHVNTFNSINLLKSDNAWLETENVAGLVFNKTEIKAVFEAELDHGNGDFHRIREGKSTNNYSFLSESYQAQNNRLYIYGKFAYHFVDDNGGQWNGTYDPYSGNPYILADSVSGVTYHKENYNLAGGLGYKLNDRLSLGCGAEYYAGIAAKQKDPRPQNVFVRFTVNPALILTAERYKLGFDIGYSNRKEEIEYDVFRSNSSPTFFTFKGFGFYNMDIANGFSRFQTANRFFGGLQYERNMKGIPTLTELRFDYNMESIEDGTSVIRKLDGGDWNTYSLALNEHFNMKKGLNNHRFRGIFSFFNGDGNEFAQKIVYQETWNVPKYVTIGENLKFNRQTLSGTAYYNYQKMTDEYRLNWDAEASVSFLSNDESYYYIPEVFTSGYSNVTGNLSLQKNLYFGKIHLAFTLNSSYNENLSKDLQLSTSPEITKKQRKDVYLQEFEYYTSSLFRAGGEVKLGGSIIRIRNVGQAYLSFKYDNINQTNGSQNFSTISAKLGLIL